MCPELRWKEALQRSPGVRPSGWSCVRTESQLVPDAPQTLPQQPLVLSAPPPPPPQHTGQTEHLARPAPWAGGLVPIFWLQVVPADGGTMVAMWFR